MIYTSAMLSIGVALFVTAAFEDLKLVGAIGIVLYYAGMFIGSVVENRLEKRIKELEDKLKEAQQNVQS